MKLVFASAWLVACWTGPSTPPAAPPATPPSVQPAPPAAATRRCLPVVAKECGCVYACGTGTRDGDRWRVTHAFWKDSELTARVEPWCVGGTCTDAFAAEIVCDGICAPKPADPTCHFDESGACRGN